MTMDYTSVKSYAYLDKVGIMHTGVKSFKHREHTKPLHVPCTWHVPCSAGRSAWILTERAILDRDIALTLGWVLTVLQTSILQLPEDQLTTPEKVEALAAINKVSHMHTDTSTHPLTRLLSLQVIWIQNDFFSRHYIDE